MSLNTIKTEIFRFLSSSTPEVLALRGPWGVGKTYAWNRIISEAKANDAITSKRYSYVSLFGVNSLETFRYELFEQAVPRELIGQAPSLETLRTNTVGIAESLGRRGLHFFRGAGLLKQFAPALESLSFLSVRDMLVCIDDLERRGSGLSLKDVLGVVSLLKEQKGCKVVLILNDGEEGLEDFRTYREKVVDVELRFCPTPHESAEIAIEPLTRELELIQRNCVKLGINNIRIIKKIERLSGLLSSLLHGREDEVVEQVVHSITLFAWCFYERGSTDVPTLDYVLNVGYRLYGLGNEEQSEDEKRWNGKLIEYGFQLADELDQRLAEGVQAGYFVEDTIRAALASKEEEVKVSKIEGSFSAAWKLYHDSFENNEDQVVSALCESFGRSYKYISPLNLDGTVQLLRDLGEDSKADDLIDLYVFGRSGEESVFDLQAYPFSSDIRDKVLRQRFAEAHAHSLRPRTAKEVLESISGRNGWRTSDVEVLSETSVDEYYELFKAERGEHLSSYVEACLQFGKFGNASESHKRIAERATQALKRIGKESRLNARRVRKFGVTLEDDDSV